ncbi:hypothetical protein ACIRRA_39825 [Nocardia sp. NPDC101769]|uniref:hypothetical protein n=1 Tax=Nocardia sp. NPDC101769 TaxID=3364333 RepID=UPI0037FBF800
MRDYETHEARRWAEAMEVVGQVPEGTAAQDPDDLIGMWRAYTATQADQQATQQAASASTGSDPARGRSGQSKAGKDGGRSATPKAPTLKELVGDRIPGWVFSKPGWRQGAETTFRGLVAAGADPHNLADVLAGLRYDDARKPVALTIWAMRKAVGAQDADLLDLDQNNGGLRPWMTCCPTRARNVVRGRGWIRRPRGRGRSPIARSAPIRLRRCSRRTRRRRDRRCRR